MMKQPNLSNTRYGTMLICKDRTELLNVHEIGFYHVRGLFVYPSLVRDTLGAVLAKDRIEAREVEMNLKYLREHPF